MRDTLSSMALVNTHAAFLSASFITATTTALKTEIPPYGALKGHCGRGTSEGALAL